ncbi:anhydro-N-acetylmuramic acid kinase [Cupriavidus basilensis OR16]|uniref:Anhydro-N-acetylmuramic acid kinase n=1 Tax=Cupriavidus basilensis OR16 TaxID=1127483 RepID=H1RZ50_9BURK|nr:anhydro-N-acetylmuramic acid kinase [Cupriavidus basilensis]EHP44423.1 anhydro-N-acetylmuramic acid kinase [Cupriavidus basilensis OR16]
MQTSSPDCFIGIMSGTSMDGADGVLVDFSGPRPAVLAAAFQPFPAELRDAFAALQQPGDDEIHREALAANGLARVYAACVAALLRDAGKAPHAIAAIGAHGQTVRHRPGLYDGTGYTRQSQQPALLAELTGIDVVADFRSRDVAAGGQGAPLVPALHQALFGDAAQTRVACNIGGISNISVLPATSEGGAARPVTGFDCGPGNVLLDDWIGRHRGLAYDADGAWGASGKVDQALLARLLAEPYFSLAPPKSTGRDLFHPAWLEHHLTQLGQALDPADVQATLAALTAEAIARDIRLHAPDAARLIVCGGGARNGLVMALLARALPGVTVQKSDDLGVPVSQVEGIAFAWLARQMLRRAPGNVPTVTGAAGPRVLGALYPR